VHTPSRSDFEALLTDRDGPRLPFVVKLDELLKLDDGERRERFAQLQEFRARLVANPMWAMLPHQGEYGHKILHNLEIRGDESHGQIEFLEAVGRAVFVAAIVAGNRFGKTHANVLDAAIQTLPRELIPPWLLPYKVLDPTKRDVRMRFIGPDKDRWLMQSMAAKMRQMLPPVALHGGSFDNAFKQREGLLRFADGSTWDFLTHDMDLDAYSSVELDAVRCDEELTGEAGERKYDESIRGLVDRAGYVVHTLTPVEGIGWLFDELADENGDPRKDDETYVVTGNIDHNPHISDVGRERAKKRWAKNPATYKARAEGSWTHREGLIFPEFVRSLETAPGADQPGGHLRADRPLKNPYGPSPIDVESGRWRVPVFESIDPGINVDHPFAFTVSFLNIGETDVFGMHDVLETFYAFKAPDLHVPDQAKIVYEARAIFGYRPAFTVIDPSAQNRNPSDGKKLIDAWRKEGIYPLLGQNDRALTYNEVHVRLATHTWRIWQSCDAIIGHELVNYRWKRPRVATEGAPAAEPVKRNDDAIDTIRYKVIRIPVWAGTRPAGLEEDLPINDAKRELLKRQLAHVRRLRRRGTRAGKVGGVAP
jgi:hypothetical protein